MDFGSLKTEQGLKKLDEHLQTRSYVEKKDGPGPEDFKLLKELNAHPDVKYAHVTRWYNHIRSLQTIFPNRNFGAPSSGSGGAPKGEKKKDAANLEGVLVNAEKGKVVTRFPPEPSGYMHIGHAKAAMLNHSYAKMYDGKFLIRFDDTNPSKEKMEFEENILSDCLALGIKPDQVSHTSDFFPQLQDLIEKLIKEGKAYVDDTNADLMKEQRDKGVESERRTASAEDNLKLFKEMVKGSEKGQECCVRGKIDMKTPNKCLRDPVFYRCKVDIPHHRTGTKYKAYPTYDFCCAVVDAWEGVTHALRTIEYKDREPMYYWVLEACGLRKIQVVEFAKTQFSYTILSKRKLTWFVDNNHVDGWNDPRFPTVQGILRRGLTVEALLDFVMTQGASKNTNLMEWDKIWAINKQKIDPVIPRYMAVASEDAVELHLDGPAEDYVKMIQKHPKDETMGERLLTFSRVVYLDQDDAQLIEDGEQITLMKWGNVYVDKLERKGDKVVKATGRLNLSGNVKDTKKKIHWIAKTPAISDCILREYDHLVTKAKLEDGDVMEDLINPKSVLETRAHGDACIKSLQLGQKMQLERRGYFIVDHVSLRESDPTVLIRIPDGKTKEMSNIKAKVDPKSLIGGGATNAPSGKSPSAPAPQAGAAPSAADMAALEAQKGKIAEMKANKASKEELDVELQELSRLKKICGEVELSKSERKKLDKEKKKAAAQ